VSSPASTPTEPGPDHSDARHGPVARLRARLRVSADARRSRRDGQRASRHTAFVLAGGGSRGAVQVGMLEELIRRGIRADRVFGASVGAINGASYAGDPTADGIEHMKNVWLDVKGTDIFPRGTFDGPWAFF
jgi:predicted acylesterase/phospholipase RssA